MEKKFLPLLLILILIQSSYPIITEEKPSISYSTLNWMSNIPDDKLVLFINIPGAHDTAANEMVPLAETMGRTQNQTIPDLLKYGIRKLDIRVALWDSFVEEDIDDNLHTCHGIFDCFYLDEDNIQRNLTFKHILLDIKNFLQENPSETVILWTQSEKGDSYENLKRACELMEKYIGDIFIKYNKNLKLGEVRGKIISTVYKDYNSQGQEYYHKGLDGETDLEEIHMHYIDKYYYNSWEVTGEVKIQEVLEFFRTYNISIAQAEADFEKNIDSYPYCYPVSCTGEHQSILPFPRNQADIVNPFILSYDFIKGNYYGWIEMDFASLKLAKKLIDTNFMD